MNPEPQPPEPPRWSRTRWWSMLALVFTFQLALIFWLGARGPVYVSRTARVPNLRIAGPAFDELLALTDPTLFALPHQQGFAGPAWLTIPRIGGNPFVWSDSPSWLPLPVEQLGAVFRDYITSNQFGLQAARSPRLPEFSAPELANWPELPRSSAVRFTGDLARLALITPPVTLSSWTNSEVLTNSVVQLLVGSDGRPVSVTLLSTSGSKEADQSALTAAIESRFQPPQGRRGGKPSSAALAWGQMIFEWHTVPPPSPTATNNPN